MQATDTKRLALAASVFVPELKAIAPDVANAIATFQRVRTILEPALERMKAKEAAFLEIIGELPELNAMSADIAAAIDVAGKLGALVDAYMAKIAAAEK